MIQQKLAAVMEKLNVGVNTDNNLFVNIRQERENHLVEMNNSSQIYKLQQDIIASIIIWKRFQVLLFSLNNLFFGIDVHF